MTDVNDNAPAFVGAPYYLNVSEQRYGIHWNLNTALLCMVPSHILMLMILSLYFKDYATLFSLVGSTVFNGIQAVDADQPGKQTENWKLWKFIFNFNPMFCTFIRSLLYCGIPYGAWALLRLSGVWKPARRTAHSRKGNAEKSHHKKVKKILRGCVTFVKRKIICFYMKLKASLVSYLKKVCFLFFYTSRLKTFTKYFPSFFIFVQYGLSLLFFSLK